MITPSHICCKCLFCVLDTDLVCTRCGHLFCAQCTYQFGGSLTAKVHVTRRIEPGDELKKATLKDGEKQ